VFPLEGVILNLRHGRRALLIHIKRGPQRFVVLPG
jgi:hypothetical protein